jgi:predicted HNH restriction endonuclease
MLDLTKTGVFMPRLAQAIHVVEKRTDDAHLRRVLGRLGEWETGYWVIGDATAKSLIGGVVYVHRGQNLPSHEGGEILKIYYEPGSDLKRRVILFKSIATAKNITTDRKGWGNERKIVWDTGPSTLTRIANDDDESAFPEGAKKYVLHHTRERDSAITRKAKRDRLAKTGKLECDVCDFNFLLEYGKHGDGFIEAHHTIPVAQLDGKVKTRIQDLALVCSNCHRMLHRGKPLLSVEQLRKVRQGEI